MNLKLWFVWATLTFGLTVVKLQSETAAFFVFCTIYSLVGWLVGTKLRPTKEEYLRMAAGGLVGMVISGIAVHLEWWSILYRSNLALLALALPFIVIVQPTEKPKRKTKRKRGLTNVNLPIPEDEVLDLADLLPPHYHKK